MKFTKKAGVIIAGAALLGTNLVALPLEAKTASALNTTYSPVEPWDVNTSSNSYEISELTEIGEKTIGSTLTEIKSAPKFVFKGNDANKPTGTKVQAVLTDPYNEEVKLDQDDLGNIANDDDLPTLDKRGTYTLYYVLLDNDSTELAKTETLQIKVTGSNYSFDFPTNQFYTDANGKRINAFLPEKTGVGEDYEFTLPIPNVINSKNGEYVDTGKTTIIVTDKNGENVLTYDVGTNAFTEKNTDTIKISPVAVKFENGEKTKDYVTLNVQAKATGVYKITYKYTGVIANTEVGAEAKEDGTSEITAVYDVNVLSTDTLKVKGENVRKLSATFEGTGIGSSAVIGKEFTVPAPKVTNKNDTSETIDFRTEMRVAYVNKNGKEEGLNGEEVGYTDISSTFKFTPKAGKTGLYRIYYKVYDAYGNDTIWYCQPLTNVADTERPNVYVVEDYEATTTEGKTTISFDGTEATQKEIENGHFDASYKIPTVLNTTTGIQVTNYGADTAEGTGKTIDYKAAIVIPAVYATDNAVDYDGLKDALNRKVILSSGTFVANRLSSFNVKDEWVKQHPGQTYPGENKAVVIYLEYEGEYTIEYSAYDGARYSYDQYKVTVGNANDERTPNIEDLKVGYTYEQNSEVKFARPTADDDVDTRVKVETYYYFATKNDETPKFLDSANGDVATALKTGNYKYADVIKELTGDAETNATGVKYSKPTGYSINAYKGTGEDLENYYIPTAKQTGKLYIVTISRDYSSQFKNTMADEVKDLNNDNGMASVVVTEVAPAATVSDLAAVKYHDVNVEATKSKYQSAKIYDGTTFKDGEIGYYDFGKGYITNVHQHNEVLLPYLEFSDNENETFDVSISVSYLDETTKKLQASNYTTTNEFTETVTFNTTESNKNVTIVGGRFIPTKVGYYVVTYTARDRAGHLTSVTFQMIAKDTEKPSVLAQGYNATMEIGESQTFYQAVITDNGERVNNPQNVVMSMVDYGDDAPNGVNPTKSGFDANNKTFAPTVKGEYHFKFSYTDGAGNVGESDIIKITVDDTTKPAISLIDRTDAVSFVGVGETTKYPNLVKDGDSYKKIVIPNFTAEDNSGKQFITYSVSVKKGGDEMDVVNSDKAGTNAELSFIPGKTKKGTTVGANGEYEITYTATDRYGNAETQTYKLAVGDVTPPTIEFVGDKKVNEQNRPSGEIKLNKDGKYTLTIDARKVNIKATDESGEFANANAQDPTASTPDYTFGKVTVYLSLSGYGEIKATDPDTAKETGIYTFELDTAGSYTLRYSVTDRAGNYTSDPYNFTVVENDGGSKTATIVWAVVLSVLALCGLGVAIYFLLRDKKGKKPRKAKAKQNKDDNDEGKLVV